MILGAPYLLIHIPSNVFIWVDMDLSLSLKHAEMQNTFHRHGDVKSPQSISHQYKARLLFQLYGGKLEVAVAVCEQVCKHNFE
jgi:hypothetical protein